MPDLKITEDAALLKIEREYEEKVRQLQQVAASLREEIKAAAATLRALPPELAGQLADVDHVLIEPRVQVHGGNNQIGLNVGNGVGPFWNLTRSLARGTYRITVLLVRVGDIP